MEIITDWKQCFEPETFQTDSWSVWEKAFGKDGHFNPFSIGMLISDKKGRYIGERSLNIHNILNINFKYSTRSYVDIWIWAQLADYKLYRLLLWWRTFPFKYYRLRGSNHALENRDIRHIKISGRNEKVFIAEESEVSVFECTYYSQYILLKCCTEMHWQEHSGEI